MFSIIKKYNKYSNITKKINGYLLSSYYYIPSKIHYIQLKKTNLFEKNEVVYVMNKCIKSFINNEISVVVKNVDNDIIEQVYYLLRSKGYNIQYKSLVSNMLKYNNIVQFTNINCLPLKKIEKCYIEYDIDNKYYIQYVKNYMKMLPEPYELCICDKTKCNYNFHNKD